jgi:hypothetical protein
MSLLITRSNIVNLDAQRIPQFTYNQFHSLKEKLHISLPENVNTLRQRVREFQILNAALTEKTTTHKIMHWYKENVPLEALLLVTILGAIGGLACAIGAFMLGSFLMYWASAYTHHLDEQHQEKVFHCAELCESLKSDLQQAVQFWQQHGTELLEKIQTHALQEQGHPNMAEQIQNGQSLRFV